MFAPTIIQEPTEDVLRREWQKAEARASDLEAQLHNRERAHRELREREGLLHVALETTLTWLYRRENWHGLSADGRHSEPGPKDIWADRKYAELGLNGVAYQPPPIIGAEVYSHALHPYTRALLSAVPSLRTNGQTPVKLEGDPPDPGNPPRGCKFHPRCPIAQARCRTDRPALREWIPGHMAACHYALAGPNATRAEAAQMHDRTLAQMAPTAGSSVVGAVR